MFGSTLEPSQILLITHTNGHCPSLIRSLESCLRSHQPQLTVIILKKRNTINLTLRLQLLTGWTPSVVSENVVRATDELLCHNNAESSLPPPPRYNWSNVQPRASDVSRPRELSAVCIFPSWHTTAGLPLTWYRDHSPSSGVVFGVLYSGIVIQCSVYKYWTITTCVNNTSRPSQVFILNYNEHFTIAIFLFKC